MGEKRIDIQILRGFAVFVVMLAHFGALVPGGFIGVDIFFTISGFVITLSLVRLRESSGSLTFVLSTFYKRRFFRLVPALVAVVLVTLVLAFLILPPGIFRTQAEMSIWALFFAGNVGAEFLDGGGYFAEPIGPNWLLHLWSLGVEEQFYFVFPLLFFALFHRKGLWSSRKGTLAIACALAIAIIPSLLNELDRAVNLGGLFTEVDVWNAVFGYYSPLTRAWQFLMGALAAQVILLGKVPFWVSKLRLLSMVGLPGSVLIAQESELHPGPLAILISLFVLPFLLSPLDNENPSASLLRPLSWLGDRSYSAYLWHWPIWSLTSYLAPNWFLSIPTSFILTLVFAWLSHRYIEKSKYFSLNSIREVRPKPFYDLRQRVFAGLVLGLALVPAISLGGQQIANQRILDLGFESPDIPKFPEELDCFSVSCPAMGVNALMVGDSHAGALFDALRIELLKLDLNLGAAIQNGCFHLAGDEVREANYECTDNAQRLASVVSEVRPSWIFLHGYTASRLTTINSGVSVPIQMIRRDGQPIDTSNSVETYALAVSEFVKSYSTSETRIMFISGVPDFSYNLSTPFLRGEPATTWELLFSTSKEFQQGAHVSRLQFLERHGGFEKVEIQAAGESHVHQFSPWSSLCSEFHCSQITPEGNFVYADTDHLSAFGANRLATALATEISKILRG